jgi:hypothetical protein
MTLNSSKYGRRNKTLSRRGGGRNGLARELAPQRITDVIRYVSLLPRTLLSTFFFFFFFLAIETHFIYLQKYTPLRRRETTVTSDGLHEALRFWPKVKADGDKKAPTNRMATRQRGSARRSLILSESAHNLEIIGRRRSTGMAESGMGVVR